jgi:hypothetical protein
MSTRTATGRRTRNEKSTPTADIAKELPAPTVERDTKSRWSQGLSGFDLKPLSP